MKAAIRAKVEHPFRVLKRQFVYTKVRYRCLAKNTLQITTLFALANLWMARKKLGVTTARRPASVAPQYHRRCRGCLSQAREQSESIAERSHFAIAQPSSAGGQREFVLRRPSLTARRTC